MWAFGIGRRAGDDRRRCSLDCRHRQGGSGWLARDHRDGASSCGGCTAYPRLAFGRGGELLDRSYTVNTQQLSQLVPALNYSSANPRNTAFTIRGLGSSVVAVSQADDGLEPGVDFYVDQVYHARPATAAFDFSDIAQIEVLRGPQ